MSIVVVIKTVPGNFFSLIFLQLQFFLVNVNNIFFSVLTKRLSEDVLMKLQFKNLGNRYILKLYNL